jgi:hypothetical protein
MLFMEFYIFLKSFCKNIRRFENCTHLTTIRRGPRRPLWPTTVSGLTVVGHGGSEVAVGYSSGRRRLQCPDGGMKPPSNRRGPQVAYGLPPWATTVSFLINERKRTFAMACTVLVP